MKKENKKIIDDEEEILLDLDVTQGEFRKSAYYIYSLVNKYALLEEEEIHYTNIVLDIFKLDIPEKLKIFHALKFTRLLNQRKSLISVTDENFKKLMKKIEEWSKEKDK